MAKRYISRRQRDSNSEPDLLRRNPVRRVRVRGVLERRVRRFGIVAAVVAAVAAANVLGFAAVGRSVAAPQVQVAAEEPAVSEEVEGHEEGPEHEGHGIILQLFA